MKKKWIIGFAVILLLIVGYCGYQKMVEDANIIFPVNNEELFDSENGEDNIFDAVNNVTSVLKKEDVNGTVEV